MKAVPVPKSLGMSVVAGSSLAVMSAHARDTSSLVGTSVMDAAKSKSNPGMKPKSDVLEIDIVAGRTLKTTQDTVAANGMTIHSEVTYTLDGKDSVKLIMPAPPPSMRAETVAVAAINERTHEVRIKDNGKLTVTIHL